MIKNIIQFFALLAPFAVFVEIHREERKGRKDEITNLINSSNKFPAFLQKTNRRWTRMNADLLSERFKGKLR